MLTTVISCPSSPSSRLSATSWPTICGLLIRTVNGTCASPLHSGHTIFLFTSTLSVVSSSGSTSGAVSLASTGTLALKQATAQPMAHAWHHCECPQPGITRTLVRGPISASRQMRHGFSRRERVEERMVNAAGEAPGPIFERTTVNRGVVVTAGANLGLTVPSTSDMEDVNCKGTADGSTTEKGEGGREKEGTRLTVIHSGAPGTKSEGGVIGKAAGGKSSKVICSASRERSSNRSGRGDNREDGQIDGE